MSVFICDRIVYRHRNKTASRPTSLNGIVVLLDGYDASLWLRYCNTVKIIWSCKVKQTKTRLTWKYVGYYMSTKHVQKENKTASRETGNDAIVVLFDVYDASLWLRYCNTVKIIWGVEIKQMNECLIWKYVGICMSKKHIQTDI